MEPNIELTSEYHILKLDNQEKAKYIESLQETINKLKDMCVHKNKKFDAVLENYKLYEHICEQKTKEIFDLTEKLASIENEKVSSDVCGNVNDCTKEITDELLKIIAKLKNNNARMHEEIKELHCQIECLHKERSYLRKRIEFF